MFIPGEKVDVALENFILNFYLPDSANHRASLLADTAEEGHTERLEAITDALIAGARNLSGTDVDHYAETIESLIAIGPYESFPKRYIYLLSAIDARVAEDLTTLADAASARIEPLIALVQRSEPSPATTEFLRRVSRCFLYGFDAECAIMCRSALDAEFESEISPDDCVEAGRHNRGRNGEPICNLNDRIETAAVSGRVPRQIADVAHEIRRMTNMTVHRKPRPPGNLPDLIEGTLRVISALHRNSKRHKS